MGSLYKRTFKTSEGKIRERPTWWLKYHQNGRAIRESTGTTKETVARRMLKLREGDVAHGIPVNPRMDRITFDEAARDVVNDYTANAKKSLRVLHHRIAHLRPFFGDGHRMSGLRVSDIRAYIVDRQRSFIATGTGDQQRRRHPSHGQINRELTTLKRMFSLAVQAEKLARKPHIPLLAEAPARAGFFEREQIDAVCRHLPSPIAAVIRFAFVTGWRVDSEVLTLRWANVDWPGESLRLEAGTTKGGEPRVFPFTDELSSLLQEQRTEHEALKRTGTICPFVFHRAGKPIKSFVKIWRSACRAAGCPGRIPHDLRRTAVRNLERAGVPRSTAMAMVGHKTESIYRRYAIVDDTSRREAAEKLNLFGRGHSSGHSGPLSRATGADNPRKSL